MTNEEAINVINTWIEPMRNTLKGELTHEFLDAVEVLKKQAISDKTSDKYRWHDLRKDPKDLPKTTRGVVIAFHDHEDDATTYYDIAFYGNGNLWYSSEIDNFCYEEEGWLVIAWKDVEEFEV